MTDMERSRISKKYDQYCNYAKLPILLKRFSFSEKMKMANFCSSHAIYNSGDRPHDRLTKTLPWCMETFVMLSMDADEFANEDFSDKNYVKFEKMHDAIWKATATVYGTPCGRFEPMDVFLAVTGQVQFQLQESSWIRKYRYWKIFNDDSEPVFIKSIFKQKLGAEYNDYLMLANVLQILFFAQSESNKALSPVSLDYLLRSKFPEAASNLLITRARYIELQKQFSQGAGDPFKYVYSLCPSYQFPFVEEKNVIYFPLPHLFNHCVTSSLLCRLTEANDKLRSDIGKHLWERYVYELIDESGVYQETFSELPYKNKGSNASSPDVLARQGNEVLFLDSKSTMPRLGIRLFEEKAFEENIKQVSDNIVKLYHHITRFRMFDPFKGAASEDLEDHWGIVMVLEDAYIRRKHYYEAAKEKLCIVEGTKEWDWLINHIKVLSLYEIERICLSGHSLIEACKVGFQNDPFNLQIADYPPKTSVFVNEQFLSFKRWCTEGVLELIKEMEHKRVL